MPKQTIKTNQDDSPILINSWMNKRLLRLGNKAWQQIQILSSTMSNNVQSTERRRKDVLWGPGGLV